MLLASILARLLRLLMFACSGHANSYSHANESLGVKNMRLLLMLCLSLFMFSSCSYLRSGMVNTMDVIVAPYHYIFDEEEEEFD